MKFTRTTAPETNWYTNEEVAESGSELKPHKLAYRCDTIREPVRMSPLCEVYISIYIEARAE